ncbi:GTP-binding protein [Gorillibacterium timonense]|uniref:GTP-binding protein n=1 Tax=Gorillibacterium timonense TaxID=1689269 RepID=UPI00071C4EB1|nr:GTP-binding protein [Gorillibacterium timonense]
MKLITVAGPPSSGKTSVMLRIIPFLKERGLKAGVVKFDCIASADKERYAEKDVPVLLGLAGNLCPDHFFVTNIEDCLQWGISQGFDLLISESAGLCNRCSPFIRGSVALCVIDNLSGMNTPAKMGPLLKQADVVAVTKGDIVSQAEREVFEYRVRQVNNRAEVLQVNGLTGQGTERLARLFEEGAELESLNGSRLRFSMPAAVCSYCLGETRIGSDYQMGNVKSMVIPAADRPDAEGAS